MLLKTCFRLTKRIPVVGFFSRRLLHYQRKVANGIESIKDVSFRGSLMGLLSVTIVWIAIFLYIAFYYTYMPSITHIRPIHVVFQSCGSSEVCSYPTALVKLTRKQQLLMVGQSYKIVIHMEMPESPANRELGMFMVCALLKNHEKSSPSECNKSCRATMLHYRSPVLQALTTLALSPFMIFGNTEEKQTISVDLYSEYEDDQNCPVTEIEVQILSKRVELYSAKLGIHAHLSGLRYLMYHWPITSAFVGICCNLFFILFIAVLSWWRLSQAGSDKDYQYNFSSVPRGEEKYDLDIKLEKSDYESYPKDEMMEDADIEDFIVPKSSNVPTPSGSPALKRRLTVTAESLDPDDDVLEEEPLLKEELSAVEGSTKSSSTC